MEIPGIEVLRTSPALHEIPDACFDECLPHNADAMIELSEFVARAELEVLSDATAGKTKELDLTRGLAVCTGPLNGQCCRVVIKPGSDMID